MKYYSHKGSQRHKKALAEYGVTLALSLVAAISWIFILKLLGLGYYQQVGFILIGVFSAFLILKNPKMGILLIGATIPMQEVGVVFQGFTVSKLVGLFTAYVWILHRLARKKSPFAGTAHLIPLLILLLILAMSVGFSELPRMGLHSLLSFVGFIIMYMMICESIENKRDLAAVVNVLIFSTLCVAVVGVMQYFTSSSVFEVSDITKAERRVTDVFISRGRIRGAYYSPNFFALHLILVLPLSLFFFINERKKFTLKCFYLAATLISCLAIFLTQSRAAWLAFIAVGGCLILFQKKGRLFSLLMLALFCGFFTMFGTRYTERAQTITEYGDASVADFSIAKRMVVYKASIEMFYDRPLLGVGINQTKKHVQQYANISRTSQPHNVFLLVLVENGIFALFLFCWILFGTTIRLVKYKAPSGDPFYRWGGNALFASMIGFIVFGLYHDSFWGSITWYMLGLAYAIPALREKDTGVKAHAPSLPETISSAG